MGSLFLRPSRAAIGTNGELGVARGEASLARIREFVVVHDIVPAGAITELDRNNIGLLIHRHLGGGISFLLDRGRIAVVGVSGGEVEGRDERN